MEEYWDKKKRFYIQETLPESQPDQYDVFQNHTFLFNTDLSKLDDTQNRGYHRPDQYEVFQNHTFLFTIGIETLEEEEEEEEEPKKKKKKEKKNKIKICKIKINQVVY